MRNRCKTTTERLRFEACEPRRLMAADSRMQVGMNLENIVDWSPAWTFTDAFQSSRSWISQATNTATGQTEWDVGQSHPLRLDGNGNVASLATWTNATGQTMRQMAGTLMFRELDGQYPGGTYRAEWDGTGVVTFGFDARAVATGRTADGHNYADLEVTPGGGGILLRIEETSPADPVRNIHVWMPDYAGQSFAGQRWQPGAAFSPFHPLFRERLDPFAVIRFMQAQETNTSDIRTWADRRDASDIRQSSGMGGSPSEPLVNGMSVEYMVRLANDLHADPWFNMPHMADDGFVLNFATYVRDHLDPGLKAYVEWSNEIWNFGWGFEASQWVDEQTKVPANAGLSQWQVAGREAARDLDIWSQVFAGQTNRVVRVAGGFAANDWVTARVVESMGGSFDAIAIAPYFSPTDDQRAAYTTATTVDRVLADTRAAVTGSIEATVAHQRLADEWSTRLGRDIKLLAYEGGAHLDGRSAPYQDVFYAAANDPRMGDIYRDYLRGLDAAGMDLYVDFNFTGQAGASSWGDFAKLHRMDEPLATAYRYNAVVAAADGSLWSGVPAPPAPVPNPPPAPTPPPTPAPPPAPPPVVVTLSVTDASAAEAGRDPGLLRVTRSGSTRSSLTVGYTIGGTATNGVDYDRLRGTIVIPAGQASATIVVRPIDDTAIEDSEQIVIGLAAGAGYSVGDASSGAVTLVSNDRPTVTILATDAAAAEAGRDPGTLRVTRTGPTTSSLAVAIAVAGSATRNVDYEQLPTVVVIPAGASSASIEVRPIDDAAVEPRESVVVRVSAASAYLVGKASAAVVQIADDDRPPPRTAALGTASGPQAFSSFAAAFASLVPPTDAGGTKKRVGA